MQGRPNENLLVYRDLPGDRYVRLAGVKNPNDWKKFQGQAHDLYAFDPNMKVSLDSFIDIIGRHFKQPKEGLGYDNSPVAHMWRTLIFPDNSL